MHRTTANAPRRQTRGFTIVEVLAVVGTIAVLLGLLLAGLQAARRTGRKTVEFNHLRQIHTAWTAYTASNADYAMPGFIDPATQDRWRVRYRFEKGGEVPQSMASYYPWRLLPYLDWGYEPIVGYSTNDDIVEEIPRTTPTPPQAIVAQGVNNQPWFGYNAFYVGGWWEADDTGTPKMRYANGTWLQAGANGIQIPTQGNLVVRTVGRATQASSLVLFAGGTERAPGLFNETNDTLPGAPWVSPSQRGETAVWNVYLNAAGGMDTGSIASALLGAREGLFTPPPATLAQGSNLAIEVFVQDAVPYRRLASTISVVHMDGNTSGVGIGELVDQRRWINAAHDAVGNPLQFVHSDQ